MALPKVVKAYLDEHIVPYDLVHHPRDFTAQETAAHTHTPGKSFAKTVIVEVDGEYLMAVIPAHRHLHLSKMKKHLHAEHLRLVEEDELRKICPDCEVGAMPPFGALYDLDVVASLEISQNPRITFNAGTHEDAIRILYSDFNKLVHPKIADIAD